MQDALFTGVFAALTAEHRLDITANNLANVNTSGYKQDRTAFKDTMIQFAHDQIREPLANTRSKPLFPEPQLAARVRIAVSDLDMTQGAAQYTGNALDVALAGEGFFQTNDLEGNLYFTRNGAFTTTPDGTLTTKEGWPVVGTGGPIVIPPGTANVHIDSSGNVYADGAQVGTMQLMSVDDPKGLEKFGSNMYRLREGTAVQVIAPDENNVLVNQGFLEGSNVNVVTSMVDMIETNRYFESIMKVMQAANALDSETYNKIGKPR